MASPMMVLRRCPTCISFAMLGLEKSTTTRAFFTSGGAGPFCHKRRSKTKKTYHSPGGGGGGVGVSSSVSSLRLTSSTQGRGTKKCAGETNVKTHKHTNTETNRHTDTHNESSHKHTHSHQQSSQQEVTHTHTRNKKHYLDELGDALVDERWAETDVDVSLRRHRRGIDEGVRGEHRVDGRGCSLGARRSSFGTLPARRDDANNTQLSVSVKAGPRLCSSWCAVVFSAHTCFFMTSKVDLGSFIDK